MDRSTTKEEYKAFMRKWRAVLANCGLPDNSWRREKSVQDEARYTAFAAVYKLVPCEFWDFRPQTTSKVFRGLGEPNPEISMKMNTEGFCANSYPHKTRNP